MLTRALMLPREELVTVRLDDTLKFALDKINERNFLSIPVVEDRTFKGVISKEKIFEEYFEAGGDREEYLNIRKVSELIRTDIPQLSFQDSIEKAAFTLEIYGVPFVAIVNDRNEFEGIITHHVIFREFTEILGLDKGKKLTILTYDIPGQIAKLSDLIRKHGGDIISFVIMDPKVKTDVKEIVIRVRAEKFVEVVDAVRNAGYRVQ